MRRTMALLASTAAATVGLVACQDQPEVGPVVNRDGIISAVKNDGFEDYKDVILTGSATCDADETVEIGGTITQGAVVTTVEGGFFCEKGKTIRWVDNFGENGTFRPDPRLQAGDVLVRLRFDSQDTGDRVVIERKVTLATS